MSKQYQEQKEKWFKAGYDKTKEEIKGEIEKLGKKYPFNAGILQELLTIIEGRENYMVKNIHSQEKGKEGNQSHQSISETPNRKQNDDDNQSQEKYAPKNLDAKEENKKHKIPKEPFFIDNRNKRCC